MFFSVWSLPSLSKKSVPFVLEWPFSQYVMIMHWIEKNVNFQNFSCKFSISRKLSNKFPPLPTARITWTLHTGEKNFQPKMFSCNCCKYRVSAVECKICWKQRTAQNIGFWVQGAHKNNHQFTHFMLSLHSSTKMKC